MRITQEVVANSLAKTIQMDDQSKDVTMQKLIQEKVRRITKNYNSISNYYMGTIKDQKSI